MKRYLLILIGCLTLHLLSAEQIHAQNFKKMRQEIIRKQQSTRSEIDALNDQLDRYKNRLSQTEQKYDKIYEQTQDLEKVVAIQTKKVEKLQNEQQSIEDEIDVVRKEHKKNEAELKLLIENYKKSLRYLYKNGRETELAMILSSKSVNQMLVRSYYLNKFEKRRKAQAQKIKQAQKDLEENERQLKQAKQKNEDVLAEIRQEKEETAKKKRRLMQNITKLREDRNQLQGKISDTRKQKQQLNKTLTDLINEEEKVRKALSEQMKKNGKSGALASTDNSAANYTASSRSRNYVNNETLNAISDEFANEKGKLPWPVKNGVITEKFGRRRDPVLGTYTENLGIDISAKPNSPVHAVFDGYVFAVRPLPGYGDLVFVNHGRFKTVYGNLSKVLVRKNSFLEKGDIVGLSGEEDSAKGETVFFMIRDKNQDLDPEKWIQSK